MVAGRRRKTAVWDFHLSLTVGVAMKTNHMLVGLGVVCALTLLTRAVSASSYVDDQGQIGYFNTDDLVTFSFDENGNNTLTINRVTGNITSKVKIETGASIFPSYTITPPNLPPVTYEMPATLRYDFIPDAYGYLSFKENKDGNALSDLILFWTNGIYVYSDIGDRNLTDVGIPTVLFSGYTNLSLTEQGGENGWNGYRGYVPTPADGPGYIGGGVGVTYNFTSDVVPLPGAFWTGLTLLGGVAGVSALRRRFARRHA